MEGLWKICWVEMKKFPWQWQALLPRGKHLQPSAGSSRSSLKAKDGMFQCSNYAGWWWLEHMNLIFHHFPIWLGIKSSSLNWLIFFRGVETTNQYEIVPLQMVPHQGPLDFSRNVRDTHSLMCQDIQMPCRHITKGGPSKIHHVMLKGTKTNDSFEVKRAYIRISTLDFLRLVGRYPPLCSSFWLKSMWFSLCGHIPTL